MEVLQRVLSRPAAKPYRTRDVDDRHPYLNEDGHLDFAPGDVENPRNWSNARRWYVTFVSVVLVVNATMSSSAPSGCLPSIAEEFGISLEAAGLTITLFLLGYCAGPLFFAPLSEFYGRRSIFYVAFLCYTAFNFLCAWAPNFGALLVGRFLAGTFAAASLSNSPGVLADIWSPTERANGLAAFSCMVSAGPSIGPIIGGFLQLKKDWRWVFYALLWLAGGTCLLMLTFPETYAPVVLRDKARRIRQAKIHGFENVKAPIEDDDRTLAHVYKVTLTRPWIILFDPISFFCALYLSVVYMLLYMLFAIYPIVFQQHRHWNSGVGQLPLIGVIVGCFLGALGVAVDSRMQIKKLERGLNLKPEDRLPATMVGGVMLFVSMFWFAWSAEYQWVHWIVPSLAGIFIAMSMMLIFVGFLNYLVDVYLIYAASAVAANTVMRSAFGAVSPLFTRQMFDALGVGGGGSLLGGIAAVLALIPFAFYKYGETLRRRSKFAPTAPKLGPREIEQQRPMEELVSAEPSGFPDATDQEGHKHAVEVDDSERDKS